MSVFVLINGIVFNWSNGLTINSVFSSMFDELKEVNFFKEITDFKSPEIERLKSLQKSEAYLEPKRASTMELFVNILNGLLFP